jgi:hypothetical protein
VTLEDLRALSEESLRVVLGDDPLGPTQHGRRHL